MTVNPFAANTLWMHRFISYVCSIGCWRDRMYNVHKEKFHLGMLILDMFFFWELVLVGMPLKFCICIVLEFKYVMPCKLWRFSNEFNNTC